MDYYSSSVPAFTRMLKNLDAWLEASVAYAKSRGFEPDVLVDMRLAPDQFSLIRQIGSACDTAKFCAARFAGKEAPTHADNESTFEQARARVKSVIAYLETFEPKDFISTAERKPSANWMGGKWMTPENYLHQFALPNFYFHINHAYAILRHAGVPLGKIAYLGAIQIEG